VSGGGGRENRLAAEISPYLQLHKNNPVDWYAWGPEALEKARSEDKPIFLSVGYATCYWCHVMERESFADGGTAQLMNEHFVNVKVDREERPELDEIYMAATQIFTHQGGWPNSLFLTPQLKPFFAGTYFPPTDRYGRPSFRTVLLSMKEAWERRRDEVYEQAEELAQAMRGYLEERGRPAANVPPAELAAASMGTLAARFDARHGGFGGAPKFPTPSNLFLLLELAGEDRAAAEILSRTLDAMAQGGIYDQLAGGFHRYATDAAWKVPHFEKMLYDNGLLLEVYARDYARTGDVERARIVAETARFLARELSSAEGALWSAIDAEVDGREGGYHAFTGKQLAEALGEEDASFLAPIFGFDGAPFFDHDYYVLHLPEAYAGLASRRRLSREDLLEQVAPLKERLLAWRESRKKPLVDDKVLADWNGLAIAGLATAARLVGGEQAAGWLAQARRAAAFLLEHLKDEGGVLQHSWRRGEARFAAYLSDYVFLVRGLLALYEATGEPPYLEEAERLTREQVERLGDSRGGFFLAAASPDVLFRSKEVFDGALPATNAVAALNLLELHRHGGGDGWLALAEKTLKAFGAFTEKQPEGARMMTIALRRYHQLAQSAPAAAPAAEEPAVEPQDAEDPSAGIVDAELELNAMEHQGWRSFVLRVSVKEGWHLYAAEQEMEELLGVAVEIERGQLEELEYPPGRSIRQAGLEALLLEGSFEIAGRLRGEMATLSFFYQACSDRLCLPPAAIEFELGEEE
jgi:uncharacterized protein YyaL (SSP411 family)